MDALLTERSRRIMGLAHEEAAPVCATNTSAPSTSFWVLSGSPPGLSPKPCDPSVSPSIQPGRMSNGSLGYDPDTGAPDDRGVSPRARRVLGFAHEEAKRCGQPLVDAEHLLLGMTSRDPPGSRLKSSGIWGRIRPQSVKGCRGCRSRRCGNTVRLGGIRSRTCRRHREAPVVARLPLIVVSSITTVPPVSRVAFRCPSARPRHPSSVRHRLAGSPCH